MLQAQLLGDITGQTTFQSKLTIGMVLHKPFPPDPRIAREAKALIADGYEVFLLCLGKSGEAPYENMDGLHVIRAFIDDPLFSESSRFKKIPFLKLEPFSFKKNRIGLQFGPLKFQTKAPKSPVFLSYQNQVTGDRIAAFGPLKVATPQKYLKPTEWLRANRNMLEAIPNSTFLHPFWVYQTHNFLKRYKPDVLHVHDLLLAHSCMTAAEAFNTPVITDLHENWPALVDLNKNKLKGFYEKWAFQKSRWDAHELFCIQKAKHIIVVTEEAKERLLKKIPDAGKISVVPNYIDIDVFLSQPLLEEKTACLKDKFVISYIGGFGPHRGIDILIQASSRLRSQIPDLCVLLAGSDSGVNQYYLNEMKALAKKLGVDDLTHFTGWVQDEEYRTYITASHIGVIPHKANEHTQATMPNKIFSYMTLGKPVICSDIKPLRRVLDETDAGLCFASENPDDLAEKVLALYKSPDLLTQYGQQGSHWAKTKYNWQASTRSLLSLYNQCVVNKRSTIG